MLVEESESIVSRVSSTNYGERYTRGFEVICDLIGVSNI